MNSKYILIFSLFLLQACVIIDEIFPPDKVQVVDPNRRKPLLNNSLPTDIGMNAINNTHAYAPSWPKSNNNVAPPPQFQASLPAAPIPVAPVASSQPSALPSGPAFQNPYSAVPVVPVAPITPVPTTPVSTAAISPAPSVPVVSTPVAPPKVVAPKAPAAIPPEFVQPKASLQYPDLAEVKQPQVAPASSELDQRVQELKRDLEISKNARAGIATPQVAPAPQIVQPPVLRPIADEPIITRPVEPVPAPVAVAPAPVPTPVVPPAFVKPVAAQPAPARQAMTLPSQLRMPSGSGGYRSSSYNGVAKEDYSYGYVHSPKNRYRHSNLRRGN